MSEVGKRLRFSIGGTRMDKIKITALIVHYFVTGKCWRRGSSCWSRGLHVLA